MGREYTDDIIIVMKSCSLGILILGLIFITSCSTYYSVNRTDEFNEKYRGMTYIEVVERMGFPDRQEPDEKGGRFLIYENVSSTTTSSSRTSDYSSGNSSTQYSTRENTSRNNSSSSSSTNSSSTTSTNRKYTQFHLNEDDIVVYVTTNRTRDYYKFSLGKTILNTFLWTGGILGTLLLIVAIEG